MTASYLKAIHLVFVVTWFAGLFYLPRLFVYLIEANSKMEPERSILRKQLLHMSSLLLKAITWPSAIATLIMGTALVVHTPAWLRLGFMHIKLALVLILFGYHLFLHQTLKKLYRDTCTYTSQQMRMINEIPTVLLIAIVFLIVLKNTLSMTWGIIGLMGIMVLIFGGIRLYKLLRNEK